MTAARLLEQNGDFKNSPLIETVRNLHKIFTSLNLSYTVVGGMAVVRNGAFRTTVDVDILTHRKSWDLICSRAPEGFQLFFDHALDTSNNVAIDILFPGDDWEMVIPVPAPEKIKEYDSDLGAFYIDLFHLLELKTAVFIKKRDEDGIEVAAKDLADLVALTDNNDDRITSAFIDTMDPAVREEYRIIVKNIQKRRR